MKWPKDFFKIFVRNADASIGNGNYNSAFSCPGRPNIDDAIGL